MRQIDRPAKVAVVDDHAFRRVAIQRLVESWETGLPFAVSGVETFDALLSPETGRHDLYLIAVGGRTLTERQLQTVLRQLRVAEAESAIVVISDLDSSGEARAALDLGLDGYLPTAMEPDVALAALSFIMSGGAYFPPRSLDQGQTPALRETQPSLPGNGHADPAQSLRNAATRGASGVPVSLTARQEDVLLFLKSGKSNKEIANALDLSEATVKVHVRQLMKKLGVANRTQVALLAAGPEASGGLDLAGMGHGKRQ